jgi:hypothetical protein
MDLQEYWKEPEVKEDALDQLLAKGTSLLHKQSKGPLQKLRRNLLLNMAYGVIITLGYGVIIYMFPIWQVQMGILVCIVFNFWLLKNALEFYNNIDPDFASGNVLQSISSHYHYFKKWCRQQEKVALFVYPVAATAGFMLGGVVGSGKTVNEFMGKPVVLIALLIALIILVPCCFFLARWMNKVAFGKYIDQLKANMDALEKEG